MALHLEALTVPRLSRQLLPETTAAHLPDPGLRPGRLLPQTTAEDAAVALLPPRRLLPQAVAVCAALLPAVVHLWGAAHDGTTYAIHFFMRIATFEMMWTGWPSPV